ncbi:hypothetical protein ABT040_44460 [Streptomyces sp. NPDC002688]|uniref:hypothetical protein n=1 Tax=Streptomyces sp. NPDC002688 TaxID=3154423 RepID=UPI003322CEC7
MDGDLSRTHAGPAALSAPTSWPPQPTSAAWPSGHSFSDPEDLIAAVRQGLRQLQYRSDVLDGRLIGTGLIPGPTMTTTHSRT